MICAAPTQRKMKLQAQPKTGGASRRAAKSGPLAEKARTAKLLKIIRQTLADAKAEDIVTLPLDGKAAFADHMVIASGRSNRHVSAISGQLEEALKKNGFKELRIEGLPHCDWVLIDATDVIVHIFRPEVRSFYNLEKLWSLDAPADHMAN